MRDISPFNITQHEIIGLDVLIKKSADPTLRNLKGRVVDETKNMLIIRLVDGRKVKVNKKICVFRFKLPDGTLVEVDGVKIIGRPEDRIKKFIKRKW